MNSVLNSASGMTLFLSAAYGLIALSLFAFAEAYQRRKQARLGKRSPVWVIVLFAILLAPFILLQIVVAGCVVVLSMGGMTPSNPQLADMIVAWAPAGLLIILALVALFGLLSMGRAGR